MSVRSILGVMAAAGALAASGAVRAQGLQHAAVGSGTVASLNPYPWWRIQAQAANGDDGARVSTLGAASLHLQVNLPSASSISQQARILLRPLLNVPPGGDPFEVRLHDIGSEWSLAANYTQLQPQALRIRVSRDGVLVQEALIPGGILNAGIIRGAFDGECWICPIDPDCPCDPFYCPDPFPEHKTTFITAGLVVGGIAGQSPVNFDRIDIDLVQPHVPLPCPVVLPSVDVLLDQLSVLDIHAERVGRFGNTHAALGKAQYAELQSLVRVTNTSLSGGDGIELVSGGKVPDPVLPGDALVSYVDWDLGLVPGSPMPVGSIARFTTRGLLAPVPQGPPATVQDLGTTELVQQANVLKLHSDFSAAGATSYQVEVLNNGLLVAAFSGLPGVDVNLGIVCEPPRHETVLTPRTGCGQPLYLPCFRVTQRWVWDDCEHPMSGLPFQVVGDELRITPEQFVRPLTGITGVAIRTANAPHLVITDEHSQFICYTDCNRDGQTTVADFGCFQTKFVLGDPYANCNGDNLLSVADFGCFQTRFVAGCP